MAYVASWTDLVDQFSSIYSILPLGYGRFLVGGSNHALLKVFDMQRADEFACPFDSSDHISHRPRLYDGEPSANESGHDWNVFLSDRGPDADRRSNAQRRSNTPVYSLSSPNSAWPTIYAGLEGQVIQLDLTSVYDRFPDPVYNVGSDSTRGGPFQHKDAAHRWGPGHEVMCLSMYEQVPGQPTLRHQAPLSERGDGIPGWDERWKDVSRKGDWNIW